MLKETIESQHILAQRNPLTGNWLMTDKRPGKDNFQFWSNTKKDVKKVISFINNLEGDKRNEKRKKVYPEQLAKRLSERSRKKNTTVA